MLNLDAIIGMEVLSIPIILIMLVFCTIMECRRAKHLPVAILYILMLVLELFFIIFSLLRHLAERHVLITQSLSLDDQYYIFRGLANVALFLLLIAYVLCVVMFLSDKTKLVKFFTITSVAGCGVMAALFLISVFFPDFSRIMYTIDSSGVSNTGWFYFVSAVIFYVAAFMIFLLIKYFKKVIKPNLLAVISFILCPTIVLILRFFGFNAVLLTPATLLSFILMFFFSYMWQTEHNRRQEIMISQNRLAVLQSQIGPHFLYNTLNSIYVLCEKDPKAAQSAISSFSEYMRANLECLEGVSLIPLDKELEYTEHYLNLEKMRYGDNLDIEYDIDFADIMIPPMSIQILTENAVKHGIANKASGVGRVTIRTRRMVESDLVIVEDNGVGFDVDEYGKDTKTHIGIQNVRERLSKLLGATLIIESEIGKSTVATISIPRKKAK